jgi:hypothetical protein
VKYRIIVYRGIKRKSKKYVMLYSEQSGFHYWLVKKKTLARVYSESEIAEFFKILLEEGDNLFDGYKFKIERVSD